MVEFNEKFTSLHKINLSIDSLKSFNLFKEFADKYNQRITSLELRLKFNSSFNDINETFEAIARFNQIRNISVYFDSDIRLRLDMTVFSQHLVKNCPKLYSLSLELKGKLIILSKQLYKPLQQISTLKTLDIKIRLSDWAIKLDPFSSLQSTQYLTHLHIMLRNISDDYLSDIHLYCPQLESIELKTGESVLLSDQSLQHLKKLKQLERLVIFGPPFRMTKITDSGICSLIANCKHLDKIKFNCGIRISDRTFEALKQMANKSPKRLIDFKFCWDRSDAQKNSLIDANKLKDAKSAADFWPILNDLPQNLSIINELYYYRGRCGTGRLNIIMHYLDQFK